MIIEGADPNGLPIPIKADTTGRALLAGASFLASATITRPADTTAYAAKDVISTGAGAILTFPGMGRVNGGSGLILRARLMTSQKTNVAQCRLHLFHTAPTAIADNSPYLLLYANAANRVGMIDFPAMTTEDATNSTAASAMRPSSDGNSLPPNLWYQCAAGDTALYGILETLTAFTPASAQTYFIELGGAQD